MTSVEVFKRGIVIRWSPPSVSARLLVRTLITCAGLALCVVLLVAVQLSVGSSQITMTDAVRSLLGQHTSADVIVREFRLPRAMTALVVGLALGTAGALFQSATANPLASPDVLGISSGAGAGAVFTLLVMHWSSSSVTLAAFVGALSAVVLIALCTWRARFNSRQLLITGVAVSAALTSLTMFFIARAEPIVQAEQALVWLIGSLNGRGWQEATPVALTLAVFLPVACVLTRRLRVLALGDEVSRGLGLDVSRTRIATLGVGTGLAAVATAAAGPIGFVALGAPHVAQRLTRTSGGPPVITAALTGAVFVLFADVLARSVAPPLELPAGVFTAVLGAPYLLWWALRANRGVQR